MINMDKLDSFYDTYCIVYSSPKEEEEPVSLGIKHCTVWGEYHPAPNKLYGVRYGGTHRPHHTGKTLVPYEEAKQLLGISPIWCSSS